MFYFSVTSLRNYARKIDWSKLGVVPPTEERKITEIEELKRVLSEDDDGFGEPKFTISDEEYEQLRRRYSGQTTIISTPSRYRQQLPLSTSSTNIPRRDRIRIIIPQQRDEIPEVTGIVFDTEFAQEPMVEFEECCGGADGNMLCLLS